MIFDLNDLISINFLLLIGVTAKWNLNFAFHVAGVDYAGAKTNYFFISLALLNNLLCTNPDIITTIHCVTYP